jgi:mRNA interferase RelE/StbE
LADFRIFETNQFQKDMKELSRSGLPKLLVKLHAYVYPQLRSNPATGPHVKRLKGRYSDIWRYRIGAWRFFYTIHESERIVSMIAATHRGRAY